MSKTNKKQPSKQSKKVQAFIQLGLFLGILIIINILSGWKFAYFDLTEDKRFSLTAPTKKLIKDLNEEDERLFIEVYLEGEFPAGFKRLQSSVRDVLNEFRSLSPNVDYQFINPNEGSVEDINRMREGLKEMGIAPTNLMVKSGTENKEMLIFPAAMMYYKGRTMAVNLLENEQAGVPQEVVLNNSVSLLEYKFANSLQKMQATRRRRILFTKGHGELNQLETADLQKTLVQYYDIARVNLDSTVRIPAPSDTASGIDILVIAKPQVSFPEKHKFIIDQFVMEGGKVMWLIDNMAVSIDSMQRTGMYVPYSYDLNLEDMLYKYGARINPNLVLDLECTKIPQVVGQMGNAPQFELFDWWYHLAVNPKSNHPIVKGLDRINIRFGSTIDTIRTKTPVEKTILLTSSKNARFQRSPVRLNFEILRYPPQTDKFNKADLPMGVLLEGTFPSLYKNRVSPEMSQGLKALGQTFRETSIPTKMVVFSDGDIAKNPVNLSKGSYLPLGYNEFVRYKFANKDMILNAFEYLLDENGIIAARTKEVKLRLLDKVRTQEEKSKWQFINIALPLIFLVLFGIGYNFMRRRRFAS